MENSTYFSLSLEGEVIRPDSLNGKKIVDAEAQVLEEVAGIEIDIWSWTVTHLCMNPSDVTIEALSYKKPFLGKVQNDILVGIVKAQETL